MGFWSAENATKAYLRTMRMGKNGKEPNGAEFISALAAGNNAQLMVIACSGAADSTAVALLAAAHQTGGRIVCILPSGGEDYLRASQATLGTNNVIEFVIGDANKILSNSYNDSDFIAIDCNLDKHQQIISTLQRKPSHLLHNNTIVLGYNAFCRRKSNPLTLRRIGEGLLVTRLKKTKTCNSNWVVTVDKCTGEEHVFRVTSSDAIGKNVFLGP